MEGHRQGKKPTDVLPNIILNFVRSISAGKIACPKTIKISLTSDFLIILGSNQHPPRVDPLSSWLAAAAVVVSESKSCLKSAENWAANSLRYGYKGIQLLFARVKTPMGLERFEVGKKFRPISQSLGIY